jgi:hypothetical protein
MNIIPLAIHKPGLQMAKDVIENSTGWRLDKELGNAIHEAEMNYLEQISSELLETHQRELFLNDISSGIADKAVVEFLIQSNPVGVEGFLNMVLQLKRNSDDFHEMCKLLERGTASEPTERDHSKIHELEQQMEALRNTHIEETREKDREIYALNQEILDLKKGAC